MVAPANDAAEENKDKSKSLAAGSFSGGVSRFVAAPFDVLKIRFQVQIEPLARAATSVPKYTGLGQAARTILKEEGVKGFWRGNLTAEYLWIAFHGLNFFFYDQSKAVVSAALSRPQTDSAVSFISGGIAGGIATVLSYPFDIIRTTLAAQGEPKVYHGIVDASRGLYGRNGYAAFFQGLGPQIVQIVPYVGSNFAIYEAVKQQIIKGRLDQRLSSDEALAAGVVSGSLSKFFVLPLDLVKKRIQVNGLERCQSYGQKEVYVGALDCMKRVYGGKG
eukprot:CAMPEP_0113875920 /NCGR_PEP_ID=MMETSP0780_2-20120614/5199_1 /TAXON_ID=652834 /ORGANISM="Palpitomonas bilix" /LENGTH=275 /DNA_ID=CAMNT_0000861941 /DNA_START=238 /DNA_END=1066 /DNA_ORIENTATION=+ /assembly_acc=CAM_ASM_000599